MYTFLIFLIIGLFLGMLFVNIYFRVRVFKHYKVLVQNRVEFGAKHIFSKKRMEAEILPKYPKQKDDILAFVLHMRRSINMATVLALLITAFGAVLMYYRDF